MDEQPANVGKVGDGRWVFAPDTNIAIEVEFEEVIGTEERKPRAQCVAFGDSIGRN